MKRTYRVTITVEVHGKNETDFQYAVQSLTEDPPHLDRSSIRIVAPGGCFSARGLDRGVTVRRARK